MSEHQSEDEEKIITATQEKIRKWEQQIADTKIIRDETTDKKDRKTLTNRMAKWKERIGTATSENEAVERLQRSRINFSARLARAIIKHKEPIEVRMKGSSVLSSTNAEDINPDDLSLHTLSGADVEDDTELDDMTRSKWKTYGYQRTVFHNRLGRHLADHDNRSVVWLTSKLTAQELSKAHWAVITSRYETIGMIHPSNLVLSESGEMKADKGKGRDTAMENSGESAAMDPRVNEVGRLEIVDQHDESWFGL